MPKTTHPKTAADRTRYQQAQDSAARREILAAMGEASGARIQAATLLGLEPRTFYREIERLSLWDELDRLARVNGWPAREGSFERKGPARAP